MDEIQILPWYIVAGDDGLLKDFILAATLKGEEPQTVGLYLVEKAQEGPRDV